MVSSHAACPVLTSRLTCAFSFSFSSCTSLSSPSDYQGGIRLTGKKAASDTMTLHPVKVTQAYARAQKIKISAAYLSKKFSATHPMFPD